MTPHALPMFRGSWVRLPIPPHSRCRFVTSCTRIPVCVCYVWVPCVALPSGGGSSAGSSPLCGSAVDGALPCRVPVSRGICSSSCLPLALTLSLYSYSFECLPFFWTDHDATRAADVPRRERGPSQEEKDRPQGSSQEQEARAGKEAIESI